ncbi:MAG: hypothetical protein NTX52_08620 [Planctomycetota bacterium]|nr:hypothetical protein [Planctomycetota bacterium]
MLDFTLVLAILFFMTVLATTVFAAPIIIALDVGKDIRLDYGLGIIGQTLSFLKEIVIRW